jgi:hypothetical protein
MHYSGENYGAMTAAQKWAVYCVADGFGECSPEELAEINGGWDWSHVRDSSSGAVRKMAAVIEGIRRGVEMTPRVPTVEEVATAGAIVAACMREGDPVPEAIAFKSGAVVPCSWAEIVVGMVEAAYGKVKGGAS